MQKLALLLLPATLSLVSAPSAADADGASATAALFTSEAVIGGSVDITLRSPLPGSTGILAFGFTPLAIVFPGALPVLHVGPPFAMPSGTVGADGRLVLTVPIAPAYPPGTEVFVQAAVVDFTPALAVYGSAPIRLAPGGAAASLAIAPAALPAAAAFYSGADADWVDVNKDGRDDVFVANAGTGALPLVLMNQGGSFVDQALARLPAAARVPLMQVEPGDVDQDGDMDLFLAGGFDVGAPAPNLMLRNSGSGSFAVDPAFPAGAGRPFDAELGDADGDGDLDLVVANQQDPDQPGETPDGVELYLQAGGLFAAQSAFSAMPATDPIVGGSVSLGDADNDGDLDVFIARSNTTGGGDQNRILENDGAGVFTDMTTFAVPPLISNTAEAEFVDVNGDGLLDVLSANSISSLPTAHHLLLNLGISPFGFAAFNDASFLLPPSFGPATKVRTSLDIADVDGDGDPDAMFGIHQLFDDLGMLDGDVVLLMNQGGLQGGTAGAFALDPVFALPGEGFVCTDVAFGDADHDGDPDVYLASDGDLFGTAAPQDLLLVNSL